ncbi:unnamed protein product [Effrenium voratum]|uniref:Uncharacterized protein n=1 Tax=Effrenium voratum TaxID=2562239 RepID=A0AA36JM95_9DINO|nr:unnamed protein product [Effrenium voratum]
MLAVKTTQTSSLLPADTPAYSHLLVYTASSLTEQTTPVALVISDAAQVVGNLSLFDLDLDLGDLGGEISWTLPQDTTSLTELNVYLAVLPVEGGDCNVSTEGADENTSSLTCGVGSFLCCWRQPLASLAPEETNLSLAVDTAIEGFTHVLLYLRSPLAEQSTPAAFLIEDESASASAISFQEVPESRQDGDLDATELGGAVSWQPPSSSRVQDPANEAIRSEGNDAVDGVELHGQDYILYLYNSPTTRSQVGSTSGTTLIMAQDTARGVFDGLAVYTRSTLAEQSTPASAPVSDTAAAVANLSFPDLDLDATHIGGTFSWEEPADDSYVTHYEVYIARSLAEESLAAVALLCEPSVEELQAILSGSLSFILDGATAAQVEAAARSSLLTALDLSDEELVTSVSSAVRRLRERRLATTWTVAFQAVVPVARGDLVSGLAKSYSQRPQDFAVLLAADLAQLGVSTSSLSFQSFSEPLMQEGWCEVDFEHQF